MLRIDRRPCWLLPGVVLLTLGAPLRAGESERGRELRQLLDKSVKFDGIDDPKVTLAEALDAFAKRYNLSFDINDEAFEEAAIKDVHKLEIAQSMPLREMHAKLEKVLRKCLSRVSPSATYVIRDDFIEITTTEAVRREFCPDRPRGPLPPLATATFDKVLLASALKEMGHFGNVVLDARAAKEAQTAVTADFVNVPLDTAVRMLADMAGLKVVPMDNALYVTARDNATVLLDEQEKLRLQRERERRDEAGKPEPKPDGPPKEPDASKKR